MTAIASHLSAAELEARYETAADPVSKSHFHAIWLLSLGYADHRSGGDPFVFGALGPAARQALQRAGTGQPGDRRQGNGAAPAILTPEALSSLKERLKTPPDDGGLWTGPKVARWLAELPWPQVRARSARLGCAYCHRIFHPKTTAAPSQSSGRRGSRGAKKNCKTLPLKRNRSIRMPPSRSGRWMSTGSA